MTWHRADDGHSHEETVLVGGRYVMGCLAVNPEEQVLDVRASEGREGGRQWVPSYARVKSPVEIRDLFPGEEIDLTGGVWWDTLAGWVTKDGEAFLVEREVLARWESES